MKKLPVGIQLYSVRDACKSDFKGTVRELAKMGFKGVEFAWQWGDMAPDGVAAFLKECNMRVCGFHGGIPEILDASSVAYALSKVTGNRYLTTSMAGRVEKDWDAAIQDCVKAGKAAKAQGMQFTYHNHAQEFATINGVYALDQLYRSTKADEVYAELDTHWIKRGGADPVAYIRQYKGRVPQVHLKDISAANDHTELGTGVLDLKAIAAVAVEVGAEWLIYEQDISKIGPMESARVSMENLKKAGLV